MAKHEEAKIECEVDADPIDVVFHWAFNSTDSENEDSVKFSSDGRKSTAFYTPRHELDYGRLYCWAVNSAGKQREPCVFFVIQAGNSFITSFDINVLSKQEIFGFKTLKSSIV